MLAALPHEAQVPLILGQPAQALVDITPTQAKALSQGLRPLMQDRRVRCVAAIREGSAFGWIECDAN